MRSIKRLKKRLSALTRIVGVIKTYCYQTADYRDPAQNQSISIYLKQHLSVKNWACWQCLQPDERAALVYNQDSLPNDALSLQRFRLRLTQYKRAGYDLFAFWRHAEHTISMQLVSQELEPTKSKKAKTWHNYA